MTSHPLLLTTHHCFYVMAQTRFMTSYVLYMMSPILCVWLTQLYIWRETLENWNLFHSYVITPSLLKTSHLHCKISQVAYVCHHLGYTGYYIHTFWQPLLLKTSHALHWLHHTPYIWHLIYSVWCHIHYLLHHTMTLSMASNTICLCYIHLVWHQALFYDEKTILCLPSHYAWHYTQCIFDITQNVAILWQEVNVSHQASICMTPYALHMTSHPLFMTSHHFIYDVKSTISNITSTLCDLTSTVSV